ncbi:MAG TPA: PPC domain-containing protein, partial [Pirellulaceae bacterium]|nr:PPC domain-containing protein [Pirellulaceae bacterium]
RPDQVVLADDDDDVGPDCRFAHTFAASGQFLLEVRDNQYRAGGRYRLRIGDFPLATSAYPAVVQAGVAAKVGIAGADAAAVAAIDVTAPADAVGRRVPLGFKLPNGASSTGVSVAVSGLPQAVEAEPNNEAGMATALSAPGGVSGRFDTAADRDFYQFMAKQGQKFVIKCTSRSFGSPAIVKLFVQKPDGAALAETAVSEADEESLAVTIPADGAYRLVAEDLLKRGGPGFSYHVSIEPVVPFSLALKADKATRSKFTLAKNGALAIDVPVARAGYDGPINLSVEGPGGPYTLINSVIAEKQATTKLFVFSPAGFQPGQVAALKIKAEATVDGQPFATTLSTVDLIRLQRPRLS